MASGSNGHVEEGCRTTHFSTLLISRQASAEHFEQCAEFLPTASLIETLRTLAESARRLK
jgi:hypothetical protein